MMKQNKKIIETMSYPDSLSVLQPPGVFHNLPQSSVSQAAPHPVQSLLGAAESPTNLWSLSQAPPACSKSIRNHAQAPDFWRKRKLSKDSVILKNKLSKIGIDYDILNNFTMINLFNNLIHFIKKSNSEEALFLLENNKNYLSLCKSTIKGFTVLMFACIYQLEDVALAIINTGYSNPNHVSESSFTALIYAINNNLDRVAHALITNPESNLGYIDTFGNNALIHACKRNNENIALFIIRTNREGYNPQQKNYLKKNALMYAIENKLDMVAYELNKIYYPPWIKIAV